MDRSSTGRWWMVAIFILLTLAACGGEEAPAVATEAAYAIDADFESFYEQYGGALIFGAPYTGPMWPAGDDGPKVQYFERMRLEFDGDVPAGEQVQVTPLGAWAYQTAPQPETDSAEPPVVREAFSRFYTAHGGADLFGEPLSPLMIENERWVRYFENARLEWYPARPQGLQVQLSLLGLSHYWQEAAFVHREQIGNIPRSVAGLSSVGVRADVSSPILYAGDEQRLTVYVSQVTGGPVADVEIEGTMVVDGVSYPLDLGRSDGAGIVRQIVAMPEAAPGQWVSIVINARSERGIIGTTTVRFQTWW